MIGRGFWRVVLVVTVGITLFSGAAAAEPLVGLDPDADLDGNGTESDPYRIGNASELQSMAGNLSANYTLTAAVNASNTSAWNGGAGFAPIGNATDPFTGSFNGSDRTISGLSVNRNAEADVGLFGVTDGATIERVGLDDVDIDGNESVGGVVGNGTNDTAVTAASVTGSVVGVDGVGGLVGRAAASTVTLSYATSAVTGNESVGGVVGESADESEITDSYAVGAVDGETEVGGLVGYNNESSVLNESYAAGAVDGDVGVGGLIGVNNATVGNSYWDRGAATRENATGGGAGSEDDLSGFGAVGDAEPAAEMTGLNATVEMDDLAFYGTWMPRDGGYPDLAWNSSFADGGDAFDALVAGDGNETPYAITNVYELQLIGQRLSANHELTTDINASRTDGWSVSSAENDGVGFEPLGDDLDSFDGSFEGNGHSIDGVTIERPNGTDTGLFGVTGSDSTIANVTITDANVTGAQNVGALVGRNGGTISGGDAQGGSLQGVEAGSQLIGEARSDSVGGLVGQNNGRVVDSSASATVSAPDRSGVGGLVGQNNNGRVVDSNTSGTVSAPNGSDVGGLVGENNGRVRSSSASGTVSASNGSSIGGLVGFSSGTSDFTAISNASASVDVTAPRARAVGGLLGSGGGYAEVIDSAATGTVRGQSDVGGLVGATQSDIFRSFATGDVEGNTTVGENAGGLVGDSNGPIGNSSAFGDVTGNRSVGGFAGIVRDEFDGSEIAASYSVGTVTGTETVGGFAGEISSIPVVDSYWDTETSGTDTPNGTGPATGLTGLTTSELQGSNVTETTALAFNPVWVATDAYPIHAWRVDDYALSVGETTLDPDETTAATVTLTLSDGTTPTATAPAEYTSDAPATVTVDDDGLVTAEEAGTAELTAAASGFSDSVSLSVTAPTRSSTSSSRSSDDDGGDEPEDGPVADESVENESVENESVENESVETEPEPEPINETVDNATDETPENETAVESVDGGGSRSTVARIAAGGGAGAIGSYLLVVLVSRTELFAAAAPAGVAKAVAAVPGAAGVLMAEPEQAAFVVGAVALAGGRADGDDGIDVTAGETATLDVTVENKGDVPGARVVTLSLDETEDSVTMDLPAHSARTAVLEYQTTTADDGKTLGFTVDCETDSTDVDVTVGERNDEDHEPMSETTTHSDDARTDDGEAAHGESTAPDESDSEAALDADASEAELDDGSRTGLLDRIWQKKGKILSYTAGVIIIYIGTTNLEGNVFAGGLGIFLGVMALPIVRAQLPTSTRVLISRYGKVVVVIIAALFSGVLVDPAVVFETLEGLVR
ncbi:beta strand repeat-containing protein [Halorubrum lipolyticum]|uniref:BIG2 domain-containing protein n=1 Tax=Halorubrum lipolyticum DSM 21995 TaxID=1227482 RepID=M0NK69_9EURY|nr:Ig-like domain-containing protein [Halorubrum lipolyticum]EMA58241.1 hypothetical protein C469_13565 [Halorubrum lipolyticum DSM 21995]